MTYRLIALDVDGTLLNDDHVLTEKNKEAVREAGRAGSSIVLCTGRSPSNTFDIMEQLGLEGTVICHNGGATVRSGDQAVIHEFGFTMEDLIPLIAYCRENGFHYDANPVYGIYIDHLTPEIEAMYEKFGIKAQFMKDITVMKDPIVKFTLSGDPELMDRTERNWAEIGCPLTPIRSGERFIDVIHPEATKGNALRVLAKSLDIPREEVMAIGNYYNDIEMIRFAGLGIAMDNSPEPVKQAADTVTSSNNESGVAAAIRKYVMG